eukprot:GILJ01008114.1.p1 GENE.GILJ01008114.1~~GILJ01008114.1.p1  ORF type:complete len:2086 (-),score=306.12 GILJ01008114.1:412-6546(-)
MQAYNPYGSMPSNSAQPAYQYGSAPPSMQPPQHAPGLYSQHDIRGQPSSASYQQAAGTQSMHQPPQPQPQPQPVNVTNQPPVLSMQTGFPPPLQLQLQETPVWVADEVVHNCMNCDKSLTGMFSGKHHCRCCGGIFCGTHSKDKLVLPWDVSAGAQRVCDDCKLHLQERQQICMLRLIQLIQYGDGRKPIDALKRLHSLFTHEIEREPVGAQLASEFASRKGFDSLMKQLNLPLTHADPPRHIIIPCLCDVIIVLANLTPSSIDHLIRLNIFQSLYSLLGLPNSLPPFAANVISAAAALCSSPAGTKAFMQSSFLPFCSELSRKEEPDLIIAFSRIITELSAHRDARLLSIGQLNELLIGLGMHLGHFEQHLSKPADFILLHILKSVRTCIRPKFTSDELKDDLANNGIFTSVVTVLSSIDRCVDPSIPSNGQQTDNMQTQLMVECVALIHAMLGTESAYEALTKDPKSWLTQVLNRLDASMQSSEMVLLPFLSDIFCRILPNRILLESAGLGPLMNMLLNSHSESVKIQVLNLAVKLSDEAEALSYMQELGLVSILLEFLSSKNIELVSSSLAALCPLVKMIELSSDEIAAATSESAVRHYAAFLNSNQSQYLHIHTLALITSVIINCSQRDGSSMNHVESNLSGYASENAALYSRKNSVSEHSNGIQTAVLFGDFITRLINHGVHKQLCSLLHDSSAGSDVESSLQTDLLCLISLLCEAEGVSKSLVDAHVFSSILPLLLTSPMGTLLHETAVYCLSRMTSDETACIELISRGFLSMLRTRVADTDLNLFLSYLTCWGHLSVHCDSSQAEEIQKWCQLWISLVNEHEPYRVPLVRCLADVANESASKTTSRFMIELLGTQFVSLIELYLDHPQLLEPSLNFLLSLSSTHEGSDLLSGSNGSLSALTRVWHILQSLPHSDLGSELIPDLCIRIITGSIVNSVKCTTALKSQLPIIIPLLIEALQNPNRMSVHVGVLSSLLHLLRTDDDISAQISSDSFLLQVVIDLIKLGFKNLKIAPTSSQHPDQPVAELAGSMLHEALVLEQSSVRSLLSVEDFVMLLQYPWMSTTDPRPIHLQCLKELTQLCLEPTSRIVDDVTRCDALAVLFNTLEATRPGSVFQSCDPMLVCGIHLQLLRLLRRLCEDSVIESNLLLSKDVVMIIICDMNQTAAESIDLVWKLAPQKQFWADLEAMNNRTMIGRLLKIISSDSLPEPTYDQVVDIIREAQTHAIKLLETSVPVPTLIGGLVVCLQHSLRPLEPLKILYNILQRSSVSAVAMVNAGMVEALLCSLTADGSEVGSELTSLSLQLLSTLTAVQSPSNLSSSSEFNAKRSDSGVIQKGVQSLLFHLESAVDAASIESTLLNLLNQPTSSPELMFSSDSTLKQFFSHYHKVLTLALASDQLESTGISIQIANRISSLSSARLMIADTVGRTTVETLVAALRNGRSKKLTPSLVLGLMKLVSIAAGQYSDASGIDDGELIRAVALVFDSEISSEIGSSNSLGAKILYRMVIHRGRELFAVQSQASLLLDLFESRLNRFVADESILNQLSKSFVVILSDRMNRSALLNHQRIEECLTAWLTVLKQPMQSVQAAVCNVISLLAHDGRFWVHLHSLLTSSQLESEVIQLMNLGRTDSSLLTTAANDLMEAFSMDSELNKFVNRLMKANQSRNAAHRFPSVKTVEGSFMATSTTPPRQSSPHADAIGMQPIVTLMKHVPVNTSDSMDPSVSRNVAATEPAASSMNSGTVKSPAVHILSNDDNQTSGYLPTGMQRMQPMPRESIQQPSQPSQQYFEPAVYNSCQNMPIRPSSGQVPMYPTPMMQAIDTQSSMAPGVTESNPPVYRESPTDRINARLRGSRDSDSQHSSGHSAALIQPPTLPVQVPSQAPAGTKYVRCPQDGSLLRVPEVTDVFRCPKCSGTYRIEPTRQSTQQPTQQLDQQFVQQPTHQPGGTEQDPQSLLSNMSNQPSIQVPDHASFRSGLVGPSVDSRAMQYSYPTLGPSPQSDSVMNRPAATDSVTVSCKTCRCVLKAPRSYHIVRCPACGYHTEY